VGGALTSSQPMGSVLGHYTMTPQVVNRRMAVLSCLATVVMQRLHSWLDTSGNVNKKAAKRGITMMQRMHKTLPLLTVLAVSQTDQRLAIDLDVHACGHSLHHLAAVWREPADELAGITRLGPGAQRAGRCHATALRHSIRILFLDPPLRR
jgi:hypothetical protein